MSEPSATDNDGTISETVVISSALEAELGSKYSKQELARNSAALALDTDLSPRVRPGSSVCVELSARPEPSVGDLVMEDRGQHSGLPGMVQAPSLTLQPRVAPRSSPPAPSAIPPPPPLLKIPSVDHPSSIPMSSSGHSSLPLHQTPIQARYNNLPLQRRSPPGSELRSHLIDLLQAPPQARLPLEPASNSLPVTLPQLQMPRASSLSDSSDYANGDNQERSNALKCREYREKNKVKRREEELEYSREKEKNNRLREIYCKKESDIKRLKEYYLDYIGSKKCRRKQCRKLKIQESQKDSVMTDDVTQISPLVMVKAEIEFDADVLVKSEQVEKNPPCIASS